MAKASSCAVKDLLALCGLIGKVVEGQGPVEHGRQAPERRLPTSLRVPPARTGP